VPAQPAAAQRAATKRRLPARTAGRAA